MEWNYLSEEQRERLKEAINIIIEVKNEIDYDYSEFILIQTSLHSLEDAIDKERIKSQ